MLSPDELAVKETLEHLLKHYRMGMLTEQDENYLTKEYIKGHNPYDGRVRDAALSYGWSVHAPE
jgi:hypothetical protein